MLLVIDVGNTNTVLGLYDGSRAVRTFRIRTVKDRTVDEIGILVHSLFEKAGIDPEVGAAIISCVVPDTESSFLTMCRTYFGLDALVVGPGIRTGMPILADNPREVGADRIVNSVAAFARVQGPCVVVDFGTATTFDCVSGKGEYLGGVIAPGLRISAEALFQKASKLPRVNIERPRRIIGRNTVHSMQSGLFYGYVGLVDGVVEGILGEYRERDGEKAAVPRVIATGGLAAVIASGSRTIDDVDEDLTLTGLELLYSLNQRGGAAAP
jgi:type III pantothenate kinase